MEFKCAKGLLPSHICFLLTSVFYFQDKSRESACMKDILFTYARTSRQEINLAKYEIYSDNHTSQVAKADVISNIGVTEVLGTGIYLGFPSMIGKKKLLEFQGIIIKYQ